MAALQMLVLAAVVAAARASAWPRPPLDEAALKPKQAAPVLRVSVNGWTVLVPDQLEVYYDSAALDPATLTVTVRDRVGNAANCTDALTAYPEYAAVPWKVCAAPVFAAATGRYEVLAAIAPRAGGALISVTAGT
jgi:hypothetical protein